MRFLTSQSHSGRHVMMVFALAFAGAHSRVSPHSDGDGVWNSREIGRACFLQSASRHQSRVVFSRSRKSKGRCRCWGPPVGCQQRRNERVGGGRLTSGIISWGWNGLLRRGPWTGAAEGRCGAFLGRHVRAAPPRPWLSTCRRHVEVMQSPIAVSEMVVSKRERLTEASALPTKRPAEPHDRRPRARSPPPS